LRDVSQLGAYNNGQRATQQYDETVSYQLLYEYSRGERMTMRQVEYTKHWVVSKAEVTTK